MTLFVVIPQQETKPFSLQFDSLQSTRVRSPPASATSDSAHEFGILREFAFSSSRQCMSVIVRKLHSDHFTVFCKGSPEKIGALSRPASVPRDFDRVLER